MNKYPIKIILNSPVCIAQKRGMGYVIETLDYIPGSTIRGALAMLYIRQHAVYDKTDNIWRITDEQKQSEFDSVFNSENTRFGNCYFDGAKVVPLTASSCKYNTGFYNGDDQHGVFDTMIQHARYELNISANYEMPDKFEKCDGCWSVMDRFGGYYNNDGHYKSVKPSKRLIAHTAIMESTETAMPENLFTIEVLNEKKIGTSIAQEFSGMLETESSFDVLNNLLAQNDIIYIGTAKSRGLGEVRIRLMGSRANDSEMTVHERLAELNKKLDNLGKYFFSVTLHSDAILRNEILGFKSKVDNYDLIETLENIADPSYSPDVNMFCDTISCFRHHRDWLSTYLLTGWNMALGLPKEDEIAICKGSVFLFCTDKTLCEKQIDNLGRMFSLIEQGGIGERCNEGFGKIRICDEFHLEEGPK